jgi:hypothetical protein
MAGVLQVEFARKGGVSKQAITKALRHGKLVRDPAGGIDPAHPVNAAWLALHRDAFSSNGRAMDTHSHAGRPPTAAAQPREGAHPSSGIFGRNGPSAGSAAAPGDDGIDIAQLAAGLSLDELQDDAALAALSRRTFARYDDQPRIEAFIDHVAKVLADAVYVRDGNIIAVLNGIDARLLALEHGADDSGAETLARLDSLVKSLAATRQRAERGFQAEAGQALHAAVTGVRDDVAQLRRLLADLVKSLIARCGS